MKIIVDNTKVDIPTVVLVSTDGMIMTNKGDL